MPGMRENARVGIVAVAILAVLAGFGAWLHAGGGAPTILDSWWYPLAATEPGSAGRALALMLHVLGSTPAVAACIALVTVWLLIRRRWRDGALIVTAGVLGLIASESIKALVARPRPGSALVARPRPGSALVYEHSFSYPSGHSMGAAMLALSILLLIAASRGWRSPVTRLACGGGAIWTRAMMWSRTAVQVHWLTDTLAGALLGIAAVLGARAILIPSRTAGTAGSTVAGAEGGGLSPTDG